MRTRTPQQSQLTALAVKLVPSLYILVVECLKFLAKKLLVWEICGTQAGNGRSWNWNGFLWIFEHQVGFYAWPVITKIDFQVGLDFQIPRKSDKYYFWNFKRSVFELFRNGPRIVLHHIPKKSHVAGRLHPYFPLPIDALPSATCLLPFASCLLSTCVYLCNFRFDVCLFVFATHTTHKVVTFWANKQTHPQAHPVRQTLCEWFGESLWRALLHSGGGLLLFEMMRHFSNLFGPRNSNNILTCNGVKFKMAPGGFAFWPLSFIKFISKTPYRNGRGTFGEIVRKTSIHLLRYSSN